MRSPDSRRFVVQASDFGARRFSAGTARRRRRKRLGFDRPSPAGANRAQAAAALKSVTGACTTSPTRHAPKCPIGWERRAPAWPYAPRRGRKFLRPWRRPEHPAFLSAVRSATGRTSTTTLEKPTTSPLSRLDRWPIPSPDHEGRQARGIGGRLRLRRICRGGRLIVSTASQHRQRQDRQRAEGKNSALASPTRS